jgi:hypothetical protein
MSKLTDFYAHKASLQEEGKPIAKVEKLRGLRAQLERELYRVRQLRVEQECHVLRLHQPVASLVVTGLNKTIKAEKLPPMHETALMG